ncbi:branched-chain amino acid transport system permease protein [Promicromonospora umidemergens]|uniref:Branched-chain amino acid ABC transporter permease n=1 Tax=Promicromonospora umidemergens TaxID=629679 RepID=A0ABP8WN28_9MICO|nr:branched-chain amino acid ABC transporter permease [Promicromonospora umidemergens]MCP2285889.1 branched-chain amino acid transport system permease protein [Promicromonospora umidemergens]
MDELSRILIQALGQLIAPATAAYALAAIGLNLHFGYTGLLNIGQAGFMLMGAYGFAIATIEGAPFWLAFLIAAAAGALLAFVLGIPTLKLRGDYLAIVTISAAEIIRFAGRSTLWAEYTGGASGLAGTAYKGTFQDLSPLPDGRTAIGPLEYIHNGSDSWWTRIFAWGVVLIAVLLVWLITRSPWGRVLKGIREDEDAVRALGKNVFSYKMQALVLGGIAGSLAGMLFVLPISVAPDNMGRTLTFFVWTVMLLGGAATLFGPVLGSMLFFFVYMLLRTGMRAGLSDVMPAQNVEHLAGLMVGVALMCIVIFRPQGILGNKKELAFDVR